MSTAPKRKPARGKTPDVIPFEHPEDRLPPQNLEAEMGVLGGLLRDNDALPSIRLFLRPEDFYRDSHQLVYRAMLALHDAGKPFDWITLADELKRRGELDRVGGDETGLGLLEATPTTALVLYHAQILVEKARARGALEISNQTAARVYAGQQTADEILAIAETGLSELKLRMIGPGGSSSIPLSEIEPQELRWLWPDRVPLGKLTTFAGPGGVGKSFVTLDMAARVTHGWAFPGSADVENPAGGVILVSTEDDLADTTVPRLISAGADRSRIRTLAPDVLGRFALSNLAPLERAIEDVGDCRLVIIDPPTAHLGPIDEHKNAGIRALLAPLAELAARRSVAIVLVTHVSKSKAEGSANRVIGSVAWTNAVRAAWLFKKDDEDKTRRLMLPIKANLSIDSSGLAYKISRDSGRVEWEEKTLEIDADEACRSEIASDSRRGPKPEASSKFAEWLIAQLDGNGWVLFAKLRDEARNAGLMNDSATPLYNARERAAQLRPDHDFEDARFPVGNKNLVHWRMAKRQSEAEPESDDLPDF